MARMRAHSICRLLLSLCVAGLAAGCTTLVPLRYTADSAAPAVTPATPLISVGPFLDSRGPRADADWLGAIRGGYGNRLKTLRTQQPMSQVVQAAYADGLRARGVFAEAGGGQVRARGHDRQARLQRVLQPRSARSRHSPGARQGNGRAGLHLALSGRRDRGGPRRRNLRLGRDT